MLITILTFMLYSRTPFSLFSTINNGSTLGRIGLPIGCEYLYFDLIMTICCKIGFSTVCILWISPSTQWVVSCHNLILTYSIKVWIGGRCIANKAKSFLITLVFFNTLFHKTITKLQSLKGPPSKSWQSKWNLHPSILEEQAS